MAPDSVLIIDPDQGIRKLVETVLKRAGFRTTSADELDGELLGSSRFAVTLCDVNLAPSAHRPTMGRLAAASPELLRRTVVMTTAPARATAAVDAGTVYAVLSKPFDLDKLVQTVTACARASREADQRERRGTKPSRRSRPSDSDGDAPMKLESLQRFVRSIPNLERLLKSAVSCQQEAVLRAEMRRKLGTLSTTLMEAAHVEASRTRSAVFHAASLAAAQLATAPAPASAAGERSH